MEAYILDERIDTGKSCYLCKITLSEFVENLPEDYKSYDIQREIVSNIYLDSLVETVLNLKHIPPIVLVVEKGNYGKEGRDLKIKKFKILDGLQRTYRLKIIWDTISVFEKAIKANKDLITLNKLQLSRKYSDQLFAISSSTTILESLISSYKKNSKQNFRECFKKNYQWFEIWTDLTPEQEVEKMLILNAGHKPVKIKHQLELLFRNLLPIFKEIELKDFKLIREKEMSSIAYSKKRKYGEFHFSHLISALISFKEGEPVTTNTDLIKDIQTKELDITEYKDFFSYGFFVEFIKFLLTFDKYMQANYENDGIRWLGRETALDGLFAALGKYGHEQSLKPLQVLKKFETVIIPKKKLFNLKEYEKERNNLELSKVNIGNVNKKAVFHAIYDVIKNGSDNIDWKKHFNLK